MWLHRSLALQITIIWCNCSNCYWLCNRPKYSTGCSVLITPLIQSKINFYVLNVKEEFKNARWFITEQCLYMRASHFLSHITLYHGPCGRAINYYWIYLCFMLRQSHFFHFRYYYSAKLKYNQNSSSKWICTMLVQLRLEK